MNARCTVIGTIYRSARIDAKRYELVAGGIIEMFSKRRLSFGSIIVSSAASAARFGRFDVVAVRLACMHVVYLAEMPTEHTHCLLTASAICLQN